MSESEPDPPDLSDTAALLLTTFADLYRQEIGAEEDVHRTLPFFGTALGIVIGALAYAAGRLPKWPDLADWWAKGSFCLASFCLAAAVIEAGVVLVYIARAILRRRYERIGPEPALLTRMAELQSFYDTQPIDDDDLDAQMVVDIRSDLLRSYSEVTPRNRRINELRYKLRSRAASNLVGSLIFALIATSLIFITDKLGYLPKAIP